MNNNNIHRWRSNIVGTIQCNNNKRYTASCKRSNLSGLSSSLAPNNFQPEFLQYDWSLAWPLVSSFEEPLLRLRYASVPPPPNFPARQHLSPSQSGTKLKHFEWPFWFDIFCGLSIEPGSTRPLITSLSAGSQRSFLRNVSILFLIVMAISAGVLGSSEAEGPKHNEEEALVPQKMTQVVKPGTNHIEGTRVENYLELMMKKNQKDCYVCGSPCSAYYCCTGSYPQCCLVNGGCYCCSSWRGPDRQPVKKNNGLLNIRDIGWWLLIVTRIFLLTNNDRLVVHGN